MIYECLRDVEVKNEGDCIKIKADPDVLRGMCLIFDTILDILMLAEKKAEVINVYKNAELEKKKIEANAKYNKQALQVYDLYQSYLENGCAGDSRAAANKVKTELRMLSVDTKHMISAGRKIRKARPVIAGRGW